MRGHAVISLYMYLIIQTLKYERVCCHQNTGLVPNISVNDKLANIIFNLLYMYFKEISIHCTT